MTKRGHEPGLAAASNRRRSAFSGIEQRVHISLKALELGACPKVVVGFSGGPDSLCLAAILDRLARNGHVQPRLVHVNHQLRPNSHTESEAVDRLANHFNLPISRSTLREHFVEDHPGIGIEEAARRERYLRLAHWADRIDTSLIAVGHHRNDQAETVLLHLLRGSGLTGVSGMKELTRVLIPWWTSIDSEPRFVLWRPLLTESKAEIDRIVKSLGVVPIQDESNDDQRFRRNAIRHSVLPAIDEIFPEARSAISRFASIVAEEDAFLEQLAAAALERAITHEHQLNVASLLLEPTAIRRRIVAMWLAERVSSDAITLDRVEAVLNLAKNGIGRKVVEIGERISIEFRRGELVARSPVIESGSEDEPS